MIEDNENYQVISAAFPHIGKKLNLFWGYPEFNSYIGELIYDSRGGQRAGFRPDLLKAMFALALKHEQEHPHLIPKQTDIWNQKR